MAKSEFVSFRPGELAAELGKRADAAATSTTAKNLLRMTFDVLRAEAAKLQKQFQPAEMQSIFAVLYDQPVEPAQLSAALVAALQSPATVTADIIRRRQVDVPTLIEKVRGLSPGACFAIADAQTQFKRLPLADAVGLNGCPSIAALKRLGMIATPDAAWGFAVVNLVDHNFIECVMRHDPVALRLPKQGWSQDKLAKNAVTLARQLLSGAISDDNALFATAYQIALETGWRFFRVQEGRKESGTTIIQITPEQLAHDLSDGSLRDLSLRGVNAPDDRTLVDETDATRSRRPRSTKQKR